MSSNSYSTHVSIDGADIFSDSSIIYIRNGNVVTNFDATHKSTPMDQKRIEQERIQREREMA